MPVVVVADAQIPYECAGAGPALVLVTGAEQPPDSADLAGTPAAAYVTRRTLITPHLSLTAGVSVSLADQLIAVLDDMDEGRVELLTSAVGFEVAEVVAFRRPDLVRRVILLT